MLKSRIIGVLLVRDGVVVQSIGFKRYLPVGKPAVAIEYLNKWGIDEIVLLDISASSRGYRPRHEKLKEFSAFCHVPLAVGGGIREFEDISNLIRSGADKVVVNAAFVEKPSLVTDGAEAFGNQCMVVSIDARKTSAGYEAFTFSGSVPTGRDVIDLAKSAESFGAGEILLNSIDNDGQRNGYDLCLLEKVLSAVNIPVIICGGAGTPAHLLQALDMGVSAVAAANFFHYNEHSVILHKTFVRESFPDIRCDTYAEYSGMLVGKDGRLVKASDETLEKLRFEYVPEEII